MYAIVQNGGRQLKVKAGETVQIDSLGLNPGDDFTFDKVLFYSDEKGDVRVGKPSLDDVKVIAKVAGSANGPKLVAFKYKKREGYHRKKGHRQHFGQVRIENITVS